jgi:hypothetical protein
LVEIARESGPAPIEDARTARELEVLRLIEEERSTRRSNARSIELPTVLNHVHSILKKARRARPRVRVLRARGADDATEPLSGLRISTSD